jgi:TonB family protein
MRTICVLVFSLALVGCRHAPVLADTGRSSFVMIEPPPAPPPKTSSSEVKGPISSTSYSDARPIHPLLLPVYPPKALAAKAGAATVAVKVTVDANGRVTDIRPSLLSLSTPGPFADDFRAAVETALRQWRFLPAEVREVEFLEEGGTSYSRLKRSEATEAEFDLSFTFTAAGRVEQVLPKE